MPSTSTRISRAAAAIVYRRKNIAADKKNRVNEDITAVEIRLIAEDGAQLGVMPTPEALAKGQEVGLDLCEISPNAEPPVCRLMDYGKHIFQLNKKRQAARKRQQQVQVKEVKFRTWYRGRGLPDQASKLETVPQPR